MSNIDDRIKILTQQIEKLKKEKREFENLNPAQRLAEVLHKRFCTWNHTDGCSWYYHKWGDTDISQDTDRTKWLDKASAIIRLYPAKEEIDKFLKAIEVL